MCVAGGTSEGAGSETGDKGNRVTTQHAQVRGGDFFVYSVHVSMLMAAHNLMAIIDYVYGTKHACSLVNT